MKLPCSGKKIFKIKLNALQTILISKTKLQLNVIIK